MNPSDMILPAAADAVHIDSLRQIGERADGPMLVALRRVRAAPTQASCVGREDRWHHHLRGQLFSIENGVAHVRTEQGFWLLPPHRAAWLPPLAAHTATLTGVTTSWSIFLSPEASQRLPDAPCVVDVNDLMRALIRRTASWTWEEQLQPSQRRVLAVLLDELQHASVDPMTLPLPKDRRLLRIAHAILDDPGTTQTLEQLAAWAGLSSRTANRLFRAELGIGFADWRQRAMLVFAVERLGKGDSVATVSDALGYATPSGFIAMFRRFHGDSPGRYFRARTFSSASPRLVTGSAGR